MIQLLRFVYTYIVLPVVYAALWISRLFFPKAVERFRGEHQTLQWLRDFRRSRQTPLLWFHASSMGEFEQAKPVIEAVKRDHPDWQIVATFFSPSGYRHQSKYELLDAALYLPFDFPKRVELFVQQLQPDIAVFVRYDLWPNIVAALRSASVPIVVICATLNPKALAWKAFFYPLTRWMYAQCQLILAAGEDQERLFRRFVPEATVETAGDPRFDRVAQAVRQAEQQQLLPDGLLAPADLTLILGSSWEEEEHLLAEMLEEHPELRERLTVLIVPHEPDAEHIVSLQATFADAFCYTKLEQWTGLPVRILIVDVVGKLVYLYRYADCAFIGGGFGKGVHSVVEAAGYGLPMAAGPKIDVSRDAVNLAQLGALRVIRKPEDLYQWIQQMLDVQHREEQRRIVQQYFQQHQGATATIVERLYKLLPETVQ